MMTATSTHSANNNDPKCKLNAQSPIQKEEGCRLEGGLRSRGIYPRPLPDKPLITVITVVFNSEETIRDTIKSVIMQNYGNIEHIIVDGGSSDATVDILKQYDHMIDYWLSEKDNGIYDAMNKGIALSNGNYIGMLNSDDMFANDHVLQDIADRFCATKADAVFSCLNIVDKNNISNILRKYRVAELNSLFLRIGIMPPHPTFYCKRSCYSECGMYKTDYKIAADFEMLTRLLIREKISWSFIDTVTVTMRSGGLSNSGVLAKIKLNWEIVRACKENGLYTNFLFLALKLPIRLFELKRRVRRHKL
ncbi:MAG: glycosyltransferase family 2 protein [Gammaproteobacteria bacterium]